MSSEAITKNDLAEILSKIPIATSENLPGIIKMFAGTFAPTGWLLCNGAEVAIEDYPALYDVIQDTYGTASDSDHFVLPDLRGRMPLGSSNSHLLASTGGSEYLQNHAHSGTYTRPTVSSSGAVTGGITGGSHSHNTYYTTQNRGTGSTSTRVGPYGSSYTAISTNSTTHTHDLPNHTHTLTGGGYTVNGVQTTGHGAMTTGDAGNMPPFLTINYIISTGGVSRWADSAGLPIVRDVTYGGQSIVNNETANIPTCYGKLVGLTDNYSLTNSTAKLPLTNFSGVGCSEYSNGIKVNESGVYAVSGTAYFSSGFTIEDIAHLQIWQNSTMLQDFGKRFHTASPYENLNVGPYIIELSENDVVYLYAYNQAAARGSVSYYETRNFLMVHRVA